MRNTVELTLTEAPRWLQIVAPEGQLDGESWAQGAFPEKAPLGPQNRGGTKPLRTVSADPLEGVKAGAKKPTNMAKTTEVLQKPGQSPAYFYERLCEVFRVYKPLTLRPLRTSE